MKYIFYTCLFLILVSCGVKYKSVPYFTNLSNEPVISETIANQKALTIQKGDAVALEVSSMNNTASALLNNPESAGTASKETTSPSGRYLVDSQGEIRIPMAGAIKIEGLTLFEARKKVETALKNSLKEPVVNLTMVNFAISVLGDVMKPGSYPVEKESINVLEAISLAGDLNITAQRNNILLIREKEGKRQYVRLDLQDKQLFDSPYYYLKNGDILYIQPGSAKYASVDTRYRDFGLILSAISILILAFSQLRR